MPSADWNSSTVTARTDSSSCRRLVSRVLRRWLIRKVMAEARIARLVAASTPN
ncbi:Uncharacterised protein [Bordetella pertussis]|nr:Uncharacterised protein [Bordetella pertussis]